LADAAISSAENEVLEDETSVFGKKDPVEVMTQYENRAAELASEYEDNMVRFG
jgi:hypothetical protein